MHPSKRWYSPPTRREFTLLLFATTVFIVSHNIEISLRLVGVNPTTLQTLNNPYLGLGTKDPGLDADGRRPAGWRDNLEKIIAGDWEWKEGEIAGVEHAQNSLSFVDAQKSGFSYVYNPPNRQASRSAGRDVSGIGVKEGITGPEQLVKFRWGQDGMTTRAIAHVPGYTIFEKLFLLNGTFYLVTDSPSSLPPLGSIASAIMNPTRPPRAQDWKVIDFETAAEVLGAYGGQMNGTTWLTLDPSASQDPYTLFSLYRAHSSILARRSGKGFTSASGLRIIRPNDLPPVELLAPPMRFMLPIVPTFSSPQLPYPNGDEKEHPPLRVKSYNGLHPHFLKAVFPTTTALYAEDWGDFATMGVPYVFDHLILADSGAAARGREQWTLGWTPPPRKGSVSIGNANDLRKRAEEEPMEGGGLVVKRQNGDDEETQVGKPVWAAPFVGFGSPDNWWAPVRASLLSYLRDKDEAIPNSKPVGLKDSIWWKKKSKSGSAKPVLTYVSMQDEPVGAGSRLKREDHNALLQGLSRLLSRGHLSELNVVRGNGSAEVWEERMRLFTRSNIVIGPFGPHLADSLFMDVPLPPAPTTSTRQSLEIIPVAPLLMEFFPPGVFRRDQEFAVSSVGMRYMAWWNGRVFSDESLPPVVGDANTRVVHLDDTIIPLNVDDVVKVIEREAKRFGST